MPNMKPEGKQPDQLEYKFIKDALVDVYDNILRIEKHELKRSSFQDISASDIHLIHTIGLHDRKMISAVARELHLSKGTLTTNLKTLERKGYVVRIPNQTDHRVVNLGLTSKGRLLYRAHDATHQQLVKSFLTNLDEDEVLVIKKALINLEKFLKELSTN